MARSFNGTTDIINLVASSVLDITTQLAISVWINPGGNSGTNPIVGNGAGGAGGRNFVLDMRTTQSAIEISTGVSSSFGEMRVTGLTLNTGTWYHIAFSIDWTQVPWTGTMYLNGVSQSVSNVGAVNSGTPNASSGTRAIGADGVNFSTISVADIAIWKGILLTATEALGLSKGIRPYNFRRSSLLAYWPLDGLASPEPDISLTKDNGTLTGTALSFGPPFAPFTPRWPQMIQPPPPTFQAAWARSKNIVVEGVAT